MSQIATRKPCEHSMQWVFVESSNPKAPSSQSYDMFTPIRVVVGMNHLVIMNSVNSNIFHSQQNQLGQFNHQFCSTGALTSCVENTTWLYVMPTVGACNQREYHGYSQARAHFILLFPASSVSSGDWKWWTWQRRLFRDISQESHTWIRRRCIKRHSTQVLLRWADEENGPSPQVDWAFPSGASGGQEIMGNWTGTQVFHLWKNELRLLFGLCFRVLLFRRMQWYMMPFLKQTHLSFRVKLKARLFKSPKFAILLAATGH